MSSGIKIDANCTETYNQLKLGRKFGMISYKISDDSTQIVVDKTYPPNTPFETFTAELPEKDCRYVVYDFEYFEEGANKNRIVFVAWCPDVAPIKKKMMATSSKDSLRKALVGIQTEIQGTDLSEVTKEAFMSKVNKI
ncbi:cofilin [Tieghemostelium lacteum]|uniref:Cofilin n=1 Tax=Tieghemostelium lacteum TaxID=361077 RepID=A0A151ZSF0_TIELA|nr:cofilin [Tieghemostelium lacteum]|eukprot:KYQ96961.1 cofilin [Tieghemostelium lacteum]